KARPNLAVVDIFDLHDRAVGRRKNVDVALGAEALRVAKKVEEECRQETKHDRGCPPREKERRRREDDHGDDEQPPLRREPDFRHGWMLCKNKAEGRKQRAEVVHARNPSAYCFCLLPFTTLRCWIRMSEFVLPFDL